MQCDHCGKRSTGKNELGIIANVIFSVFKIKQNCSVELWYFYLQCRFAFIFYVTREGATTALRLMKKIRIGDNVLTVTPKNTNYRRLEEQNAISLSGLIVYSSIKKYNLYRFDYFLHEVSGNV